MGIEAVGGVKNHFGERFYEENKKKSDSKTWLWKQSYRMMIASALPPQINFKTPFILIFM